MNLKAIIAFFHAEMGRRALAIGTVVLSTAAARGMIPLDYAIPFTGMTTADVLMMLGIGVASTSGSSSRTWR